MAQLVVGLALFPLLNYIFSVTMFSSLDSTEPSSKDYDDGYENEEHSKATEKTRQQLNRICKPMCGTSRR